MSETKKMYIGVDIGGTTVKGIITDGNGGILWKAALRRLKETTEKICAAA